jgi:peptide/nickel transport system ATP-binding protein
MMAANTENVLEVRNLKKYFPIKAGMLGRVVGNVRAVDGISFSIKRGTTMGLVGESGCGKTTVGKTVLRLNDKTEGEVLFEDTSRAGAASALRTRSW